MIRGDKEKSNFQMIKNEFLKNCDKFEISIRYDCSR